MVKVKLFFNILGIVVGGLIMQYFLVETPDYMELATMTYWIFVTSFIFCMTGVIKLR